MKPKFYLHTSNFEIMRELKDDSSFQTVYEYETTYKYRNEYGKIKHANADYHILVGEVRKNKCPYCLYETSEAKCVGRYNSPFFGYSDWACECKNCGAQGPKTRISEEMELNEKAMDCAKDLMQYRFYNPKTWDYEILNEGV